jgi:hypothetical protein
LTNIIKHADASRLIVTVVEERGDLIVVVQDNGGGRIRVEPAGGFCDTYTTGSPRSAVTSTSRGIPREAARSPRDCRWNRGSLMCDSGHITPERRTQSGPIRRSRQVRVP